MLETVFTTISRHQMVAPGDRIVAAVSGGPDSVCLLEVLAQLAPRLNASLSGVAHFNHKLRGAASDEDQRFVAELAQRHGLPFFCAESEGLEGNLEQAARRARQRFFRSLIRDGRAGRIALGHTQDDQAETVLLRLMRGSGLAGLAGILPVTREGLIRPLLDITRIQVEAFLKEAGVAWREDHTNSETRFARNRVRREVLPALKENFNPRISESLAQLAEMARDEEAWWSAKIRRLAKSMFLVTPQGVELKAADLAGRPMAVGRRLIREAIRIARGDLRRVEFPHVERVRALALSLVGSGKVRLPGLTVTRSLDWIRFSTAPQAATEPLKIEIPGSYAWFAANTRIDVEVAEREGPQPCDTLKVELRLGQVAGPLELRGWQAGDAYWPQGRPRVHSLKELFQDLRIPSWRRAGWPILTDRDRILWAMEFGPAQGLAPTEGYSGPVLKITLKQIEKAESFARSVASY